MSPVSEHPILRVARPSDDLDALVRFYVDGLGLDILGRFAGHDGYDGLIVGAAGASYHLEFTRSAIPAGRAPSAEHLLVFYSPDPADWEQRVARMQAVGFEPVASVNPYWNRHGMTFADPDDYRVVLARRGWTVAAG
ncbi:VOC family protein [Aurantimonas sp. MSK8Z-1]|uniref:VOC family protein n=1 Tax=Mangrovibrevibacter kandeliae TaxID=2968473 RepID=UPI002117B50A|nr:VOC family protein [Aurantimonas sp. MSK8Z-1]MCW4115367.1 VOC family protein [Aurantimonas sp. MSK8Z-1]